MQASEKYLQHMLVYVHERRKQIGIQLDYVLRVSIQEMALEHRELQGLLGPSNS